MYRTVSRSNGTGVYKIRTRVNAVKVVEVRCKSKSFNSAINITLDMIGLVSDSTILEDSDTTF